MPPLMPKESAYLRLKTQDFEPDEMEAVYKDLDKGQYLDMLQTAMRIQ